MTEKGTDQGALSRQRLADIGDTVLTSGGYIAGETDRWFLLTIRGAKRSLDKTRNGLDAAKEYITTKTWVSRLPGVKKKTPSERLRRAILAEAKRAGIRPEAPEFAAFAERIAVLLELVLEGSIDAGAVDFEEGPEPGDTEPCEYVADEAEQGAEQGEGDDEANGVPLAADVAIR